MDIVAQIFTDILYSVSRLRFSIGYALDNCTYRNDPDFEDAKTTAMSYLVAARLHLGETATASAIIELAMKTREKDMQTV